MIRTLVAVLLIMATAAAQAQVDPARTDLRDRWGGLVLDLGMAEIVPYRVFTLDAPRRLVVDFRGLDLAAIPADLAARSDQVTALRHGPIRPGWSRIVVDLAAPLTLAQAALTPAPDGALLQLTLDRATPEGFAAAAGAPPDPGWDMLAPVDPAGPAPLGDSAGFTVVLDPGHGGIDPGAERGGVTEADLMLQFAREIAAALQGTAGLSVVLTRDSDVFVPLDARMTIARAAEADLFISLHADALEQDSAWGASVYTLSADDGDAVTQRLVERHDRGDLLAGLDLAVVDDRVAAVLMDMARRETLPVAARFADTVVAQMAARSVRVNSRARRQGRFSVLLAPDFPSVLIEAGFLSNPTDLATLRNATRRAPLVSAIADAVLVHAVTR